MIRTLCRRNKFGKFTIFSSLPKHRVDTTNSHEQPEGRFFMLIKFRIPHEWSFTTRNWLAARICWDINLTQIKTENFNWSLSPGVDDFAIATLSDSRRSWLQLCGRRWVPLTLIRNLIPDACHGDGSQLNRLALRFHRWELFLRPKWKSLARPDSNSIHFTKRQSTFIRLQLRLISALFASNQFSTASGSAPSFSSPSTLSLFIRPQICKLHIAEPCQKEGWKDSALECYTARVVRRRRNKNCFRARFLCSALVGEKHARRSNSKSQISKLFSPALLSVGKQRKLK